MAGVSHMLPHLCLTAILFYKLSPIGQLKEPAQRDLVMYLERVGFEHMSILFQSSQCVLCNNKVIYHGNEHLSYLVPLNL